MYRHCTISELRSMLCVQYPILVNANFGYFDSRQMYKSKQNFNIISRFLVIANISKFSIFQLLPYNNHTLPAKITCWICFLDFLRRIECSMCIFDKTYLFQDVAQLHFLNGNHTWSWSLERAFYLYKSNSDFDANIKISHHVQNVVLKYNVVFAASVIFSRNERVNNSLSLH